MPINFFLAIQFVGNTPGSYLFESDKVFVIYMARLYMATVEWWHHLRAVKALAYKKEDQSLLSSIDHRTHSSSLLLWNEIEQHQPKSVLKNALMQSTRLVLITRI